MNFRPTKMVELLVVPTGTNLVGQEDDLNSKYGTQLIMKLLGFVKISNSWFSKILRDIEIKCAVPVIFTSPSVHLPSIWARAIICVASPWIITVFVVVVLKPGSSWSNGVQTRLHEISEVGRM